ncbi:hypothetical protein K1719_002140 [Acacia pycnantha]|nr:hypothetical protein K1719_002140 [Acacia pycnantha]
MARWSGVLRVSLYPNPRTYCRVGASICLSPESKTLSICEAVLVLHSLQFGRPLFHYVTHYCPFAPDGIVYLKIFYLVQVPSANAVFFCGDRVEGTGNPVIEKLSDLQKISEILVSKFGHSINA